MCVCVFRLWGYKGSYVCKNISYPKNTIQVLFLLVVASITQYKYLEKKELVERTEPQKNASGQRGWNSEGSIFPGTRGKKEEMKTY